MLIYVYAICKNEEKFAARWMESMVEADGVCVLDTGSEDRSVEILKGLGAAVESRRITPWRFDDARNQSLALVPQQADICVCTDLDEVFTPGWRRALEAAWKPGTCRARYKYVWSFTPEGREDTVFYGDKIHTRQGYRWVNPVHEVLRPEGEEPPAVTVEDMQLNHHPDPEKSRAQYLPLLELAVREDPLNDRNTHYLGREYYFHGQYQQCVDMLRHHLTLPTAQWRDERCASCRYIAKACAAMGDEAEQRRWLLRAVSEAPHLREPWMDLAHLAYARGDWEAVLYACTRALRIADQPRTYITEAACYGALPFDLLSIACWRLGLRDRARRAAEQALALDPGNPRLQNNCRLLSNNEKNQ